MKNLLLIFFGGGVGSTVRYGLGLLIPFTAKGFPLPTFLINILGSLCIGLFLGYSFKHEAFNEHWKLLLVTGFCGGFTTFSTFSKESVELLKGNQYTLCALYMVASIVFALLATFAGYQITK